MAPENCMLANTKILIRPSIELMGRFRYRQKMAALGFFLLIPLAVFLLLLVSRINYRLTLERSKGDGLVYVSHLLKLLQDVQQHRGLSAAYLSGGKGFKRLLYEKEQAVQQDIKELDAVDKLYGKKFGSSAGWRQIKQKWQNLLSSGHAVSGLTGLQGGNVYKNGASASIEAHTDMINDILSLISNVTGSSGLVLGVRRDSFYLVDAVSDKLPLAFENAGRIRALGLNILITGATGKRQRSEAAVFSSLVRLSLNRVQEDLRRAIDANPRIGPDLEPFTAGLASTADEFDVISQELSGGRVSVAASQFYSAMTNTINSGYLLASQVMMVLDKMAARSQIRLAAERDVLVIAALMSFLFIFYMYLGTSISILDSLNALVAASRRMALGDLDAKVPVSTRDEMALVAASFNDMAGNLKEQTENLRAKTDQLQESNLELDRFASIASHDLQEPLIALASNLKLLERRMRDADQDAKALLEDSLSVAGRMQNLVRNLLQYSRAGSRAGDKAASFEKIESMAALRSALVSLSALVEESGALVTYGELPAVPADPVQLSQLFQNLISNAIKFRGQAPPEVYISAEKSGVEWVFSVKDNGKGIAPEHTGRIFEMFFRAPGGGQVRGSGIGLATCKKIVERHGGRIWVESVPGEGSVIRFTIPEIILKTNP